MSPIKPRISIVVPVFNEEAHVSDCLESLLSLNFPPEDYEIIVIDNGSTDASCDIVSEFAVSLHSKPEVRVGEVRNYGVSLSRGEILVFIDADCTVEKDWLTNGTRELERFDAVGGLVMLRDNPSWIERNWVLNNSRSFKFQNTFSGACIFIKKSVFDAIGGFDERLNAGEDSKLTHDLKNHGYMVDINPKLNVTHLGYPTTIWEFVKRQKWHASDYASKLHQIFSDRILLLVLAFTICSCGIVYSLLTVNLPLLGFFLLSWLILPGLLSIKRLVRYGGLKDHHSIPGIYTVDILYLFGRSLGLIGGFARLLTNRSEKVFKSTG